MNRSWKFLAAIVVIGVFAWACQRVPLTGRKQMVGLVSGDQMMTLSFQQYKGFLDTVKQVPANKADAQMVARVGERIKKLRKTTSFSKTWATCWTDISGSSERLRAKN